MPKGARNSDQMYGISALAKKWLVILTRNKVRFQKTFSHSTYGGPEGALAAAQAWRDETARRHPPILRCESVQKIISTNTSGIPGVRCRMGPDGKPQLWMVQTRVDSRNQLKSFSVGRYGEQAKLLAIAERNKHLELIAGRVSHHPADQVAPDTPPVPPERWQTKSCAKCEVIRASNKSGTAGVYCRYVKGQPRAWAAKTRIRGHTQYMEFSVATYGMEAAKAMAVAERERQLRGSEDPVHNQSRDAETERRR